MPTTHQHPPPGDLSQPTRGRNRLDPAQRDRLVAAFGAAGQGTYPAWSLLPPHQNPPDRWPMLGAPASARAWQVGLWLAAPTHTGRGALPALARREVQRFLDEQGLGRDPKRDGPMQGPSQQLKASGPQPAACATAKAVRSKLVRQDVMRIVASLARKPGAGDEPLRDATLGTMLRLMKGDSQYFARPSGSAGGSSRDNLHETQLLIRNGGVPALWSRYALRVVMHALGLSLEDRSSLWLLRRALYRAAKDVTLAARQDMAPAAWMLFRSCGQLLEILLPKPVDPPKSSEWEDIKALWCKQDPLFNPLRHTDPADPAQVCDWMTAELADARERRDAQLTQRLAVWPDRLADQVHAWAWAVARELMDGTRYGDFGLHEPVPRVTLAKGEGPESGDPNALHHLAVCFKKKRASGQRLHRLQNAGLYQACRVAHHTHFRFMADHPPLDGLATAEAGRKLASGG